MATSTILDERMNISEFNAFESRPTTTPCGWELSGEENGQSLLRGRSQIYAAHAYDEKGIPPELRVVSRRHFDKDRCDDASPDCLAHCQPDVIGSRRQFLGGLLEAENKREPSLRHVRYEIGEHPLADIISLSGGGDVTARVTVKMLVQGGKAAEAGVVVGDELVAVSGRPDFQRIPADRLLETLPTPTLLVFAKDANTMSNVELNDRLEKAMCLAELEAKNLAEAISISGGFESKPSSFTANFHSPLENAALQLEATANHPLRSSGKNVSLFDVPDWFNADAIARVASREAKRPESIEGRDGFAGTSWDIGDRREPTCGDENNMVPNLFTTQFVQTPAVTRETASAVKHAGIPGQTRSSVPSKEDAMVGVPHCKTVYHPGVQVELFDQVVFHPGATLLIEGQHSSELAPGKKAADIIPEDVAHDGSAYMYELRRGEARRLVEYARRSAMPRAEASRFNSPLEVSHHSCEAVSSSAKAQRTGERCHSSTTTASSLADQVLQERDGVARADTVTVGATLFEARGDTMGTDFTSRGDTLMSVDGAEICRSDTIVSLDTGNPVPLDWTADPSPRKPEKLTRSGPRLGSSIAARNSLQRVEPPDDVAEDKETLRFAQDGSFTEL